MRPTLKEIARIAGVSVSTVSLVLNEKGKISDETRALVKRLIAQSGYKRPPSSRAIGIVGKPTKEFLECLYQAAAEYGYDLESVGVEEALRQGPRPSPFAGLVVYGGLWETALLERIGRLYPTVLLGGRARYAPVDAIWVDNSLGIELAAGYLVERGHRALALLNGPPGTVTSWEKKTGFERAVSTSEAPVRGIVIDCASFSRKAAKEAASRLLASAPEVTGVIVGDNLIAEPACELFEARGIAVPRDLSVVVFHDAPNLASMNPPITAIGFPTLDIARETLAHLVHRINNPGARERRVLFKPFIIERESVRVLVP